MATGFSRREVTLAPGSARRFRASEWHDAIVHVEVGEIDLECTAGGRCRFVRGDILWFEGLDLRAIHNPGAEAAVLVAVSRGAPHTRPR